MHISCLQTSTLEGYEDGETPEGFEIPCGRGSDGLPQFQRIIYLIGVFTPPIIIGVSLGMIYKKVWSQEKRISRYGVGTLNTRNTATLEDVEFNENNTGTVNRTGRTRRSLGSTVTSMASRFSTRLSLGSTSEQEKSHSRAVMQRVSLCENS